LGEVILPAGAPPTLAVELRHRLGTLSVDVRFKVTQGWTILFGPSGSGKTTILRAIAGLLRPDHARITNTAMDHRGELRSWTTIDSTDDVFVESWKRHVPLASQRACLFPHKTVRQQIGYGMRLFLAGGGNPHCETREKKTEEMLDLFHLSHVAGKSPATLSGGEAQRVNLARAAASASSLLLLDEPFAGLDSALSSDIMRDLRAWAVERNICVLSVTHDAAEAFQLGAKVIKIADGKIIQQGSVEVVLAEERARLLAQLNSVPQT
jgi:molybdate transport system ATP-binding protein